MNRHRMDNLILRRNGMKCLIIDDDEFNRDYVKTLLGDTAECDEACNGREAVAKFSSELENGTPYDLVILDIMMPDFNGHETARAIRAIEKEQGWKREKGQYCHAYGPDSPQDAMESFCEAQSAAYLVKPVSKEKLSGCYFQIGVKQETALVSEVLLNILNSDIFSGEAFKPRIILAV